MANFFAWTIDDWLTAYRHQQLDPRVALHELRASLRSDDPAWIYIPSAVELDAQLEPLLQNYEATKLPLFGVPFVVKDNIDVAGLPTTAACPAFTYTAATDATCIARLREAGAIVLAKTNLDQFATGLVGTRSPYGAVPNSFHADYISGGSSSGSAVAVARGLVPFSLGTDTAGSGRVPAAFNNIIGLKPTKGRISTSGVVPACRSLDCVSVFALTLTDAERVAQIMEGFDSADCYSRTPSAPAIYFSDKPRLGIPAQPLWYGDTCAARAWEETCARFTAMGAELVPLDFAPMQALAKLLYGGPWVAERHAAIAEFMREQADAMNPVVHSIIEQAKNFTATDAFLGEYRRAELVRSIHETMSQLDALLVPTAPRLPTIADVDADPVAVNSQLGTWTNFVNLADCCALALPAGIRTDGLPFGVTLIAQAWQDAALIEVGQRWLNAGTFTLGATGIPARPELPATVPSFSIPAGYIRLAVVGAHLTGMPLNIQLQERGARFVEATTTAACYRLFALPDTQPPKPGLIRTALQKGAEILVELWDVPAQHFGSFVALVPAPLGIGTLTLHDGREVKGFICEGCAVENARDITHLGGWRAYVESLQNVSVDGDEKCISAS